MWPAGLPHLAFSRKTKPYKMCVLLDTVCLLFPRGVFPAAVGRSFAVG